MTAEQLIQTIRQQRTKYQRRLPELGDPYYFAHYYNLSGEWKVECDCWSNAFCDRSKFENRRIFSHSKATRLVKLLNQLNKLTYNDPA